MKRNSVIALLLVTLLTGCLTACSTVPQTEFTLSFKKGEVTVRSPKDVEVRKLDAKVNPDGTFTVFLDHYSSKNSPDVLATVSSNNLAQIQAITEFGGQMLKAGASAAAPGP